MTTDRRRRSVIPSELSPEQSKLFEEYSVYAKRIAERWAGKRNLLFDLPRFENSALIGLLEAVRKFDPARGFRFKTYLIPIVVGRVRDEARALDTVPRMARSRGEPIKETHSIDEPLQDGNQVRTMPDERAPDPAGQAECEEEKKMALELVPPGQAREVCELYYMQNFTMAQIGEKLGLSESRICQIHRNALDDARRAARTKVCIKCGQRPKRDGFDHCRNCMEAWGQ